MQKWWKIALFVVTPLFFLSGKVVQAQIVVVNGQNPDPVVISEEETLTITTSHLSITHIGIGTLTVQANPGINYTVSNNNQVTPDVDYTGPLTVPIVVTDGLGSDSYNFQIQVNAVNDAPTLDAISNISIAEDASLQAIPLTGITAGSSENQSLTVTASSDNAALFNVFEVVYTSPASTGTLNIQPQANVSGSATVTVTVTDDGGSTPPDVNTFSRTFTFEITPVNDLPVFDVINDVVVNENAGLQSVNVTGISSGPLESETITLTATSGNPSLIPDPSVTYDGTAPTATLSFTPQSGQSGSAVITVRAVDSGSEEFTRTFTVNVTGINDAPTLDPINNISVAEDAGLQAIALTGITAGPSESQTLTVTASSDNAALFSVFEVGYTSPASTGTLNIQPLANVSGTATVTVTVTDDGSNTPPNVNTFSRTFTFEITPVNDTPAFDAISDVTISENAGAQIVNVTNISSGPLENQTITLTATSDNTALIPNPSVTYDGTSSSATLTFTPQTNQAGTAIITVRAVDSEAGEFTRTFTVTVEGINDAPTLDVINNVSVSEDASVQAIPLTGISAGPSESQALSISVSSDNPTLFDIFQVVYTSPQASGTLNIRPRPDMSGTATVTVTVTDDGSNTPPSANSITRTFTFEVTPVNDPPVIEDQAQPVSVDEEGSILLTTAMLTIDDPDNSSHDLTVLAGSNYTFSGNTITPNENFEGALTVNVQVSDGEFDSNIFGVQVTVQPINDSPTLNTISNVSVQEDASQQAIALSGITAGPLENQSLTVSAATDRPDLLDVLDVVYTSPQSTGTLNIRPTEDMWGDAVVTVTVTDNGNGTVPHVNTISRTFTFTINPVNDAPQLISYVPLSTAEEQSITLEFEDLNVEDPDNNYPADFSMVIAAGANYTVNDRTITPANNFVGTLTVNVRVNDGQVNSNQLPLQIQVTPVNDPPEIIGQDPLTINEDQSITIQLSHLEIEDSDNNSGFSLSVSPGEDYSVSGATVTPDLNYFGELRIPVTVSDGSATSAPFELVVNVTPINDVPQIIGQTPVSVGEAEPVSLTVSRLTIFDPDDDYPDGFTLIVSGGANYSLVGNVVTPVAGFSGLLQVPVQVNDGQSISQPYNFQILVNSVNDPPVINNQKTTLSVNEEESITLEVEHLNITDPDNDYPDDFTLTVLPGSNYTFTGRTVTPALNYNGTLPVTVSVSDGLSNSATFNMQVQVLPVNDPPVITGQNSVSTGEDQPLPLAFSHLIVNDPDNTYPTGFTMTVFPGENYTASGLTITPATDYSGPLTVPVQVTDAGGLSSNTFNLQVQVNEGNDPPTITGQDPLPLITSEDQPVTIEFSNLIVADQDDTYPTGFSIIVQSGANYSVSGQTVTPAPNYSGTLSVGVRVNDGTSNSSTFNFQVRVDPVNDAPTLNAISNVSVPEDSDVQNIALTGITAGAQESQTLTVTASSNNQNLFEIFEILYQSPQTSGTLKVKSKPNAFGVASITVQVTDNGSNTAPSVNSVSRTFSFTVTSVNDAPVFTSTPVVVAAIGEVYEYNIAVSDADVADVVTVSALQKPAWLTLTTNGSLRLSGTPPEGSAGSYPVRLQAKDPFGSTVLQEYTLTVNARPVVNDFILTLNEDQTTAVEAPKFMNAFTDADSDGLEKIRIVTLPARGDLLLNSQPVSEGAEIEVASLTNLQFRPNADFFGRDTVNWNGFDGYSYATMDARILIEVIPVNDAPVITEIETEVLDYFVGSGPGIISEVFDVEDIDDDSLESAEIGFRRQNFVSNEDLLVFESTPTITGSFDPASGILTLTGKAPVADYVAAIRSIKYDNVSETFTTEEVLKTIFYTVSDGRAFSVTRDRVINVIDAFVDLEIPSGFTPNNDEANDTWVIENINMYPDAKIRVYNVRGIQVFSSDGYETAWDGTFNGMVLPVDTYYYTIDLNLPVREKSYKGSVTILR